MRVAVFASCRRFAPPPCHRFTALITRLAAEGDYTRAQGLADAAPPVMVKVR